jgi:hypothetical protein
VTRPKGERLVCRRQASNEQREWQLSSVSRHHTNCDPNENRWILLEGKILCNTKTGAGGKPR